MLQLGFILDSTSTLLYPPRPEQAVRLQSPVLFGIDRFVLSLQPSRMKVMRHFLIPCGIAIIALSIWSLLSGVSQFYSGEMGFVAARLFAGVLGLGLGSLLCVIGFASNAQSRMSSTFRRMQRPDVVAEIERLAKLRADGFISGDEYEAAKARLLEDL